VKNYFVIFILFFNLGIALLGIVNNNNIFLRSLIDLDPNLKHPSVIDYHDKFFE
jgi:hypothetical protein